jgi:hypothetical protein
MAAVILTDKKRGIVAGLEWRALSGYSTKKPVSNQVRELARTYEASLILIHAVETRHGVDASLGMFEIVDPEEKMPRDLYSLAALAVHAFSDQINAVLAWRLEQKTAVVVIQGGIPVVDVVKDHAEAAALVHQALKGGFGFSDHRLFTNDLQAFSAGELIGADRIWRPCSKATRLTKVPVKASSVAGAMVVGLCLAVGSIGIYQWNAERDKAALRAQLAATDPVPGYLASLGEKINAMGFDRKALIGAIEELGKYPVWEAGWMLTQIDCAAGQCTSIWQRKGGTTPDLLAARKGEEMLAESTDDKVLLRWSSGLKLTGIRDQSKAIRKATAKLQNATAFQIWRNANISVSQSTEDFKIWPLPTTGDPSRLPEDIVLRIRAVEVPVPYPLVRELIEETPPSIWWSGFSVVFSPGEAAQLLKVTLKGNVYVK